MTAESTETSADESVGREDRLAKHIKLATQIHRAPGRFTKDFVIRAFANAADDFGAVLDERELLHGELTEAHSTIKEARLYRDTALEELAAAIARAEQAGTERDDLAEWRKQLKPAGFEYGYGPDATAVQLCGTSRAAYDCAKAVGLGVYVMPRYLGAWRDVEALAPDGPGATESATEPVRVPENADAPERPYATGGFITAEQGAAMVAELAFSHDCWPFGLPSRADVEAQASGVPTVDPGRLAQWQQVTAESDPVGTVAALRRAHAPWSETRDRRMDSPEAQAGFEAARIEHGGRADD